MDKRVGVILAAAGQARRMGMGRNKAYLLLQGEPLLVYSLQFFTALSGVASVVIVTQNQEIDMCRQLAANLPQGDKITVVAGGLERQDSVARGLVALPDHLELIAVHDAARPLLDDALFQRLLAGAAHYPGVVPGLPVSDTIKELDADQQVQRTIPRDRLWTVQTPQIFQAGVLRECYRKAAAEGFYATDDAGLLERYGYSVRVIEGDPRNIKITTPPDLELAAFYLEKRARGKQ